MKKMLILALTCIIVAYGSGEAFAKKTHTLRVAGGTDIEGAGLAIDASYDPRFDGLCPGYKVVNVALMNESLNIIQLDPDKDVWEVRLSGDKKAYRALNNLRTEDPGSWKALPQKVQDLIAYPLVIPIGGHMVIDLFVPGSLDLDRFNELDVTLLHLGGKLEIIVRQ